MKVCKFLSGVSLFVVFLFGIFFGLLLFKPFYSVQYDLYPEIHSFSELSKQEYEEYTTQIVRYFFDNEKYISVYGKNGREIRNYFTKDEILHMVDVKHLVRFFLLFTALSVILFFVCFQRLYDKRVLLKKVSFFGIVFILILFTISSMNFSDAFIVFHKMFFRNSLWLLPENTKLIEMFPEMFFYDFAKVWFSIFLVANAVVYLFSAFLSNS